MAQLVLRDDVRRLVAGWSAQLVEVLPRDEYDAQHITGAISIPLRELNASTAAVLDRSRPVIVYCNDFT